MFKSLLVFVILIFVNISLSAQEYLVKLDVSGFYADIAGITIDTNWSGSGFLVDVANKPSSKEGYRWVYIATAGHVINDGKKIKVKYSDNSITDQVEIMGICHNPGSSEDGCLLLALAPDNLKPVEISNAKDIPYNSKVKAIGWREDVIYTHSGYFRYLDIYRDNKLVFIDGICAAGNSGGPILDENGKAFGIIVGGDLWVGDTKGNQTWPIRGYNLEKILGFKKNYANK